MNVHIRFENVTVTYGAKDGAGGRLAGDPGEANPRHYRPGRLGQDDALEMHQPHDRLRAGRAADRGKGTGPIGRNGPPGASHQLDLSPSPAEDIFRIRNVYELRRRVGMVFPLPVGLPLSVYENVAYAPRRAGMHDRHELDLIVETCLRQAMLWDEVKDRMQMLGTKLSGGQQQRLTLARALSLRPEILCLDEFSIAIDPVTTMRIEDILRELKSEMTIVLVTNLVQQARRLADRTAFFSASRLIEVGETETILPRRPTGSPSGT